MAGKTALRGIRDVGKVQAGQRVLVNGAAGGVGDVRRPDRGGVGRGGNRGVQHRQRRAGALDRRRTRRRLHDRGLHRRTSERYDVILDNVGNQPLSRLRRTLTPTGTLVLNAGGSPDRRVFGPIGPILRVVAVNGFVRQRLRPLPTRGHQHPPARFISSSSPARLVPVVDRTYALGGHGCGPALPEQGHARGKVVVTVA